MARHLPAVGDWVAIEPIVHGRTTIRGIFPRRTEVRRVAAGNHKKRLGGRRLQTLAANVDRLVIVLALDRDWSAGTVERYLALAIASGAEPLVVLNKNDLCTAVAARVNEVQKIAGRASVLSVSGATRNGIDKLLAFAKAGQSWALIGPSGSGKSTLLNGLAGIDLQRTGRISLTLGKGRHTTTERELRLLASGLIVIDNPGLRELQIDDAAQFVGSLFGDLEILGQHCRFRDCRHAAEPGCAIRAALAVGDLDPDRTARYLQWRQEPAGVPSAPGRA